MGAVVSLQSVPQRLRWFSRWLWHWCKYQLGWVASLGCGLLVGAAALLIWVQYLSSLTHSLSNKQVSHHSVSEEHNMENADNTQRLRLFYEALPSAEHIPEIVSQIIDVANAHHVVLQSAEYRVISDGTGKYLKYRISLPVTGNARAIQGFLLAALNSHRTLALESVSFKRDQSEARDLEARIQFALITREPASVQASVQSNSNGPR